MLKDINKHTDKDLVGYQGKQKQKDKVFIATIPIYFSIAYGK